jgi:ubiquinone/menaquinone biosynthesis C-methylase UbiE
MSFKYSGSELELFAKAINWKCYWSERIKPYLGLAVVEVGAGIGSNTEILAGENNVRWYCLEPEEKMYKILSSRVNKNNTTGHATPIYGYLENLNFRESIDTILYIDVLEHISDDQRELEIASKVLKAGGTIIIVSPAHNYLYTKFDKKIGHFRRYNKKMINKIIPSDCEMIRFEYLDSVGFYASLANKILLSTDDPSYIQIKISLHFIILYFIKTLGKISFNQVHSTS